MLYIISKYLSSNTKVSVVLLDTRPVSLDIPQTSKPRSLFLLYKSSLILYETYFEVILYVMAYDCKYVSFPQTLCHLSIA